MAVPYRINPDAVPNDRDPHSWLPLTGHPPGEMGPGGFRLMWGVLRPSFAGYRPSLSRFAQAKLAVAVPGDARPWGTTAYRHEVLLPAQAGDHLRDPQTLIETAERECLSEAKAHACYITLTSEPSTLHGQFEAARALGWWLVESFDVAVMLIQHVPSLNGNSAAPHVHMIVPGPRAITRYGSFGRPIAELARDKGRDLVLDRLAAIVGDTAR